MRIHEYTLSPDCSLYFLMKYSYNKFLYPMKVVLIYSYKETIFYMKGGRWPTGQRL